MPRTLAALCALVPSLALAWGFDGHRRLSSLMQDPLPANHCLRAWFSQRQTAALQDYACEPDRVRYTTSPNYDPNEGPRHYLEVDWVTPPSAYPRDWSAAVAQLRQYATSNGVVPWRVEDQYGLLVAAFRTKDPVQILNRAFYLSHYVADSFSVLHDTKNADPNGLHSRWESDMLQPNANLNGLSTLAATYYGTPGRADPRYNIFDVVIVGNGLVSELILADTNNPNDPAGFYVAVKDLTARRWGDALTVLSSILWSAWAEAGAPELTGFSATCSRELPTTEIVLRGYPVPGGFLHDGGVDAGAGGGSGGGAGGGGGGGAEADAGTGPPPPTTGCGCGTAAAAPVVLVVLALFVRRRRAAP